jgi:hypothetical protein
MEGDSSVPGVGAQAGIEGAMADRGNSRSTKEGQRFEAARLRAKKAYPLREEHGFFDRDAPLALLRYALIEAGMRMQARAQLDAADNVFYLEVAEILAAIADRSPAQELVERRKAERNWVVANPGPASYGKVPPPPPSMAAFPAEARLSGEGVLWTLEQTFASRQSGQVQSDAGNIKGIAASSGCYTGPAGSSGTSRSSTVSGRGMCSSAP